MKKIKAFLQSYKKDILKGDNPLTLGYIEGDKIDESISLECVGGVPIIELSVGKEKYKFLFDTGAFTVVPSEFIKLYNMKLLKNALNTVDASGKEIPLRVYTLASLKVGALEFKNFSVAVDDFKEKFPFSCLGFDGILGYNFFQDLIVSLNYQKREIRLSNSLKQKKGFSKIRLYFDALSGPKFFMDFGFTKSLIAIDSGKNDGISFGEKRLENSFMHENFPSKRTYGLLSSTFHQNSKEKLHESFLVQNFTLDKNIKIASYPIEIDSKGESLVGNEFLKLFNIIIDFPNKYLYLKTFNKDVIKKSLSDAFGFFTYWSPKKKLFISAITEGSPAERASIKLGDRILAINGEDTLDFTKKDYCNFFLSLFENSSSYEAQSSVTLVLQRNTLIKRVLLQK